MNLRNHTDHAASVERATATFTVQPPLPELAPDEQDAADTQPITPLWIADGTPIADAHERRLQEIGLLTPDVDGDDNDVDA
jgi:hypothetical protein